MKKLFNLYNLSFIIIFLLGMFLRFYNLGTVPGSLNWDEVSWGYNAYSILETGRDEHGEVLPLSFKAFGDYKQPVYVYLDAIAVAVFGLTPFAVRFPSAILGTLSILSVYFLVSALFRKFERVRLLSLTIMLLFALSPWSIQFSRVAFEANVASFFIITGMAISLLGFLQKRLWLSCLGIIILAISGYTYHSAKLFTPLLLIGLLVYAKYYYKISYNKLFLLFVVFLLASSVWIIDARTTSRGRSVLFTSNQTELLKTAVEEKQYDVEHADTIGSLTHNRRVVYGDTFFMNYLVHFEPNFLFIGNDNPRHHAPMMGVLYLASLPLIICGIVYMIRKKIEGSLLIFYWTFIAPIAGALAIQAPNASRSLTFLPVWDVFAGFGIMYLLALKKKKLRTLFVVVVIVGMFINFVFFFHQYFNHTNLETGYDWQYGYKEGAEFAMSKKDSGKRVFFDSSVEQGYIFYLFYSQYSPGEYIQKSGSNLTTEPCFHIDHVFFGTCSQEIRDGDFLVSATTLPQKNSKLIGEILQQNGKPALFFYETHK